MPTRRCRTSRCPHLADNGPWCPNCAPHHTRQRGTRPTGPRPYDDAAWQRTRLVILKRDDHTCQLRILCNGARATTVDHITPLHKGGARLDPDNLQAACIRCNSSKSGR